MASGLKRLCQPCRRLGPAWLVPLHNHCAAIRHELGHVLRDLVCVHAHRHNSICARLMGGLSQTIERLSPCVLHQLGVARDLPADNPAHASDRVEKTFRVLTVTPNASD